MDITVEISMYPLAEDYIPPIQGFIDRLNTHPGLKVVTTSTSTQVAGALDTVFDVLKLEIAHTYAEHGKVIFVSKFLPGDHVVTAG